MKKPMPYYPDNIAKKAKPKIDALNKRMELMGRLEVAIKTKNYAEMELVAVAWDQLGMAATGEASKNAREKAERIRTLAIELRKSYIDVGKPLAEEVK